MKTPPLGLTPLLSGALLISFSGTFAKLAAVPPTTAAFYRMLFGSLFWGFLLLWLRPVLWHNRQTMGLLVLTSAFFTLDMFVWHQAIGDIGPGLATILANFQVFFLTGVGYVVLREKPSWPALLAIPLAIGGLLLMFGFSSPLQGTHIYRGVGYGLLASLCYACYLLTLREIQRRQQTLGSVAITAQITFLTWLGMGCISWFEPGTLILTGQADLFWLPLYGLISQVLGWLLISRGLPRVTTAQAGLILLLQPALAYGWDVLIFHHPVTWTEGCGAGLALVAIYWGNTGGVRPSRKGE